MDGSQFRRAIGAAAMGLAVAILSGCHCLTRNAPETPAEAPATVTLTGLVANPGPVTIPSEGLTLTKAVALAGGAHAPGEPSIDPHTTLVSLIRPDSTSHFALHLVEHDLAGRVLLKAGDRVTIQPWYKTELVRGLKKSTDEKEKEFVYRVAQPLADPSQYDFNTIVNWFLAAQKARYRPVPDAGAIKIAKENYDPKDTSGAARHLRDFIKNQMSEDDRTRLNTDTVAHFRNSQDERAFAEWAKTVFVPALKGIVENANPSTRKTQKDQWVIDWDFLGSYYGNLAATVPFVFQDERGIVRLPKNLMQVDMSSSPFHPNLGALQTGIGSSFGDEAIFLLRRRFNNRTVEFILVRRLGQNPATNKLPAAAELLHNTLIFPGDEVEVKPLVQVPAILSSVIAPLMHKQLIMQQQMLQRDIGFLRQRFGAAAKSLSQDPSSLLNQGDIPSEFRLP